MKIPSTRTRRDMETAAELRAIGATWETIATQIHRQPNLVIRWTKVYREEWERLYQEAEVRWARQANTESRSVLRTMLRSESSRIRLTVADKLARYRLDEKAKEEPPNPRADRVAFLAHLDEMTDADLHDYLADFIQQTHAEGAGAAGANLESAERPG